MIGVKRNLKDSRRWLYNYTMIPGNPFKHTECNQVCTTSFRIFPIMSTLCRQSPKRGFISVALLWCLRLSHSRVKPVGLRDFSLILSIKADYSFVFQASSKAACSCFQIIRNHYKHYSSSKGIDLLFSNNTIISNLTLPKDECVCGICLFTGILCRFFVKLETWHLRDLY